MWRDELLTSDVKGKNPLKDLRVRQAFALAIDEPAIVQKVMLGLAHPTWEMWGPGVNGYDAEAGRAAEARCRQGQAVDGGGRLSGRVSHRLRLPERSLRDG